MADLDRAIAAAGTRVAPTRGGAPLPPATVLRLQRAAGNRGVLALLAATRVPGRRAGLRWVPAGARRVRGRKVVQGDWLDDVTGAVSDTLDSVADTATDVAGAATDVAGAATDVAGAAWDYAEQGAETVAGAATDVAGAATDVAGQAVDLAGRGVDAVGSAAREVAGGVVDVASDVGDILVDTAGAAWDGATQTASDVGTAIADGAVAAWDEASGLAGGLADDIADVAGSAWDRLAGMARSAASGVSEAAAGVWDAVSGAAERVLNGARDVVASAWDTVTDLASGAWDAVKSTASQVAGGVRDLAAQAWDGIKSAAGAAWDAVSGTLGSLWHSVTDGVGRAVKGIAEAVPIPGSDVRSRPINAAEIAYCRRIFGDDIDYGPVVITRGSVMSAGSARATGNAVNLEDSHFKGDTMDLSNAGYGTLVHEMTHVFQYQHNGLGYIPESLWKQLEAWRRTGDRNNAYVYRPLAEAGVPWEQWNVEQQASAVEDYNIHLSRKEAGLDHDAGLLDLLRPYIAHMRRTASEQAAES